jgi:hypothetical protein
MTFHQESSHVGVDVQRWKEKRFPSGTRDTGDRYCSRCQGEVGHERINAAQREQVAANARGEAEKILVVKKAEAEAESKALQGQGIANQRKAIIEGLQVSIEQFQKVVEGASAKEVMQLVMVTQYFDTLKSIGENDKTNTLFLAHSPAAVKEVSEQILQSMLVAERANG